MIEAAFDRRTDRSRRREQRRAARADALAVLHAARDAFAHAVESPAAAGRDGDRLERLADRLVDWAQDLERDLGPLEIARDQETWRGSLLSRRKTDFDAAALAEAMAEGVADTLLSAHAGVVLRAAVKHASA